MRNPTCVRSFKPSPDAAIWTITRDSNKLFAQNRTTMTSKSKECINVAEAKAIMNKPGTWIAE